ncbi:RxLR effector protein, partial [Phytophthora megakarya]
MRPTRINYSVLWGTIALLVCINAIIIIPVSSCHDFAIDVRAKRQLRTHMLVDDSDNTFEERTNINLSGTTGIKSLISKKAKQVAEKAKVIFTSNNQPTTNKLFIQYQVGTVKSRL